MSLSAQTTSNWDVRIVGVPNCVCVCVCVNCIFCCFALGLFEILRINRKTDDSKQTHTRTHAHNYSRHLVYKCVSVCTWQWQQSRVSCAVPFSFPWIIYSIRGELEGFVAFGRIALLLHSNKQRGLETREAGMGMRRGWGNGKWQSTRTGRQT